MAGKDPEATLDTEVRIFDGESGTVGTILIK
jgi:hypothetical protein